MGNHSKGTLVIFLFLLLFNSCDEYGPLEPNQTRFGITGVVMDDKGNVLSDVKVYCLYNYTYLPVYSMLPKHPEFFSPDSFSHNLYQNFPNPVYNSSFLRYSLPEDMNVEVTLTEKISGKVVDSFSGFKNAGLYQHHFNEIVSQLQLRNGLYNIKLRTLKDGQVRYENEKRMIIVSDVGQPNVITNAKGEFLFDYKSAFVGDSVVATGDGSYSYIYILPDNINLLFTKEGYLPELLNVTIYPEILFNRDVILQREEN